MRDALKIGAVGFVVGLTTSNDIPETAELSVRIMRPDGEIFVVPATRVAVRQASVLTTAEFYDVGRFELSGMYRCELVIEYDGKILPSSTFRLPVEGISG